MCGRFTLFSEPDAIARQFAADLLVDDIPPRYNIAPTQPSAVVMLREGARRMEMCRWGLVPSWADDLSIGSRLVNARAETLAEMPAFRAAFKSRRCIVPADGFYEWKPATSRKSPKQPMYIRPAAGAGLFGFAGLWETWKRPDGVAIKSFIIITVPASEAMHGLHDRMPAILDSALEEEWLDPFVDDPAALARLLRRSRPGPLDIYPVSTRVNTAADDDPSLIERIPDAPASLTLDL